MGKVKEFPDSSICKQTPYRKPFLIVTHLSNTAPINRHLFVQYNINLCFYTSDYTRETVDCKQENFEDREFLDYNIKKA